jgi:uncharacterized protein involved in exopolysaccharide biosynthesis
MDEATKLINDLTAQLAAKSAEREQCNKEAGALEEEARARRKRASDLKGDIAAIGVALASARTQARIATDEQAAARARAEAEKQLAEVNAKKVELDAAIKKAEEAAAKASLAAAKATEAAKPE